MRKRAFTLIELLVVVAIIALLIAILIPALGAARDRARTSTCLANLRSLGTASAVYYTQENGALIPSEYNYPSAGQNELGYFALIVGGALSNASIPAPAGFTHNTPSTYPPLQTRSALICPSTANNLAIWTTTGTVPTQTADGFFADASYYFDNKLAYSASTPAAPNLLFVEASYGMNGSTANSSSYPLVPLPATRQIATIKSPADTVFMFDGVYINLDNNIQYRIFGGRHGTMNPNNMVATGKLNIAFFDGHAETTDRKDSPSDGNEFKGDATLMNANGHTKYVWRLDQRP